MTITPRVSVVIPVYNEGESIVRCLDRILREVLLPAEVLVVHDMPEDTTVPYAVYGIAASAVVLLLLTAAAPKKPAPAVASETASSV